MDLPTLIAIVIIAIVALGGYYYKGYYGELGRKAAKKRKKKNTPSAPKPLSNVSENPGPAVLQTSSDVFDHNSTSILKPDDIEVDRHYISKILTPAEIEIVKPRMVPSGEVQGRLLKGYNYFVDSRASKYFQITRGGGKEFLLLKNRNGISAEAWRSIRERNSI